MELRRLEYFITVAEELHFGRAAEKLNMSQPPLSRQIKQLEDDLGCRLFYRNKRKVQLTEVGEIFLKQAYEVIQKLNDAYEEARLGKNGESGELILGFTGTITFKLLPWIMQTYKKEYPKINIKLKHLSTSEQVRALNERKIHVGLLIAPTESKSVDVEVLREEPFILAVHKNHPLAFNKGSVSISNLSKEPFIMTPREAGTGYYDSIISMCYDAGFSPNVLQEVKELHTIVSLVASCLGIALLPSSIKFLNNENVVYLNLKNSTAKCKVGIGWNSQNKSPVIKPFVSFLRENIDSYNALNQF